MINFLNIRALDALALGVGSWLIYRLYLVARARARTTKLPGPTHRSWLFGVTKDVFEGDSGAFYEAWAQTYGTVFQVPGPLGSRHTVIIDPKAVAHYFARVNTYIKTDLSRNFIEDLLGKGVLWAEGDDHKRQRKILNPAFTNAAIRELVYIFYESGYKVKTAWDAILSNSNNGEAIINIQKWMNCVSLDTIGIAGFGHDFGALLGKNGEVEQAFDMLSSQPPKGINIALVLLGRVFPSLIRVPTKRRRVLMNLNDQMQSIAEDLLSKTKKDAEAGTFSTSSRSIMGTLIRSENANGKTTLTEEEVLAQMKTLMLAGYETTSISLTWALMELSLHPEKQDRLRKELLEFNNGEDASYDQLMNELPYLEAVFRESLRVHPPVELNDRVTSHEDILPLNEPVATASGEIVDHITLGAGAGLIIPIRAINRSEAFWGPDAKEFKPERWLENESGLTPKSKEIPGYHHLLSFIDGPRICLGKLFAVAEFKAVLTVLIRNYVFEMRDGPETNVEMLTTLLPRPKIVGEEGSTMPMRVRRVQS